MNRYQFERIARNLSKDYGTIRRGTENDYTLLIAAMENNIVLASEEMDSFRDSDILDGFYLALHQINDTATGEKSDVSDFENSQNTAFRNAVLMAFDPFTNPKVRAIVAFDLSDRKVLKEYYTIYIRCILRVIDSFTFWNKARGKGGYLREITRETASLRNGRNGREMSFTIQHEPKFFYESILKDMDGAYNIVS